MLALGIQADAMPVVYELGSDSGGSKGANYHRAPSAGQTPKPHYCLGSIHLFKATEAKESAIIKNLSSRGLLKQDSDGNYAAPLPPYRGDCLLMPAVPTSLSPSNLMFLLNEELKYASDILFIRDDKLEDRYSVVVQFFQFSFAADSFYRMINGIKVDPGCVLRVLFVAAIDFQVKPEAIAAPNDSSELPTCSICLDRLGQSLNGQAGECDHYHPCSCVLLWEKSSCPAIAMRNHEFLRKLLTETEVTAAELVAVDKEKKDSIDNAVSHKHEDLLDMIRKLEARNNKTRKRNADLMEECASLQESLLLIRTSEDVKDTKIKELRENIMEAKVIEFLRDIENQ